VNRFFYYNTSMPIHILKPEVASQIAAGEVVERPASVVKELVENALDADSQSISISIEDAGKKLVEVSDDGAGIPAQEISLAVIRHATSKVRSTEDLFRIGTLGFRGEALAAIGSVSRLTITSCTQDSDFGARLQVIGGEAGELQPVGAPKGTQIRVEELFYNVPARLKFLKSDLTERRQIDTLVTRYALAFPDVRFQLRQDGRSGFQSSGDGDRRAVLAALYGVDSARQMVEVLAEDDNLRITGFISPIALTRSNRREILFFINRRPIQDFTLTTALVQAYHTFLMVGRYPMGMLFLEMPPDKVDVNVHPTKAEVRFREADRVFAAVQRFARRALLAHSPVPGLAGNQLAVISFPPDWRAASAQDISAPQSGGFRTGIAWTSDPGLGSDLSSEQSPAPPAQHLSPSTLATPILRLVGQIAAAYLVAEGPDGLYLIDQHAAHERILFEKMLAQRKEDPEKRTLPGQALLQPAVVDFPPASARVIEAQLPLLDRLGFQVEPFGTAAFLVRTIPALLVGMDASGALRVLVEDFEEDESPLQAEVEARIIARICKRAAVKAGRVLAPEEQRALLDDLQACRSPRTCPHGRPTMIHLSVDLLERQFGRRGVR